MNGHLMRIFQKLIISAEKSMKTWDVLRSWLPNWMINRVWPSHQCFQFSPTWSHPRIAGYIGYMSYPHCIPMIFSLYLNYIPEFLDFPWSCLNPMISPRCCHGISDHRSIFPVAGEMPAPGLGSAAAATSWRSTLWRSQHLSGYFASNFHKFPVWKMAKFRVVNGYRHNKHQ